MSIKFIVIESALLLIWCCFCDSQPNLMFSRSLVNSQVHKYGRKNKPALAKILLVLKSDIARLFLIIISY